jgi:hypothetical protein
MHAIIRCRCELFNGLLLALEVFEPKKLLPRWTDIHTISAVYDHIVFEGDSKYGHYVVSDGTYAGRPARALYSGNGDAAQSGLALDSNKQLLFDYNQRFWNCFAG